MFATKSLLFAAILASGVSAIGATSQNASAQQFSPIASATPSYTPGYGGAYAPAYIPSPTYCPPVVYAPVPRPVIVYPDPCYAPVRFFEPYRRYEPVRYFPDRDRRDHDRDHDRFDANFRFGR